MKRALKVVGWVLLGFGLLGAVSIVQFWFFRPLSIDIFFEKAFLKAVIDDPETLSQIRVLEPLGINAHSDELTESSPARQQRLAALARENLEAAQGYDRGRLSEKRRLSLDILTWFVQNQVDGEPWMFHNYPVNQMFGVQSNLPTFMLNVHQVRDLRGARDYVARLQKFPWKFNHVIEGLQLRESKGVIPPQFTVEKVLAQMRGFIEPPPQEHLLYTHFKTQLEKLADVPAAERDALLAAAQQAVAGAVVPAYQALIAYFEQLQPKATANHGVWALPDGDKFYAWCVKNHTTLPLSPEDVHQAGLAEVGRLEAEIEAILAAQGLTGGTVGERMEKLAADPAQLYPDSDDGRAQAIRDYQAIIDDIAKGLDPYFGLKPSTGVEVKRIEPFREKTAPGAHYLPAPLDKSRQGIFYINLRDMREIYKWGMRTLAYHEAVPGHHFQIGIAANARNTPTFRKLSLFTVYSEGWALYAERLAKELGYQENPLDDLGRLQAEMFRAVRLVVDSGLHYKRWTREQAIDYMRAKTGQPEGDVVAEIERYLVSPGQALAYKTGMMKIVELRERAKRELGPRFDLREFHDVVLGSGPMPLPVLEQRVAEYLAAKPR